MNTGIANACTGKEGDKICKAEAELVSKVLSIPEDSVLLGSTGVIGMQLPVDKILHGIELLAPELSDTLEAATDAAKAIMTTDTRHKTGSSFSRDWRKNSYRWRECKRRWYDTP